MRSSARTTPLRLMVLGVVAIGVGVLLLFQPTSTSVSGARLECGSAAAPSSVAEAGYDCSIDERRFAAVSTMTGGALFALVAGLWPTLRGTRAQQRTSEFDPHR